MNKEFVRVLCDVHCEWDDTPPIYRLYVNDELFAERTYTHKDEYLEEDIQIEAEPGQYSILYELIEPHSASLRVENMRVVHGKGEFTKGMLEIYQ